MKLKYTSVPVFIFFILLVDWVVAYRFSSFFTKELLTLVNKQTHARVVFKNVQVHPLFLSVSAKEVEIFDPDASHTRVLYSQRLSARVDIFSLLLKKRIYLSALHFEQFELKVIKDMHGVLNVEKVLEPDPMLLSGSAESTPVRFHGSKYQDWLFNWYERIRFASKRTPIELKKMKPFFQMSDIQLDKGTLVLADRAAKPVVFRDIHLRIKNLRWFRSGAVFFDSVSTQGKFKTSRRGTFDISVERLRREIRVLIKLRGMDLELLKPVYAKTSPVYFDRGFITWISQSRFGADNLYSVNRIKIDNHLIKSTVGWSQESNAIIRALNRHKDFELNFKINGTADHFSFQGFAESLGDVLKKDFNKSILFLIQRRTVEELDKVGGRLAKP